MAKQHKTQLYTLFRQLRFNIESRDDLGSMIAYTIIASLIDFTSNSGAEQDIMFEQITVIYKGLESAFAHCQNNNTYQALCELNVKVTNFLNSIENETHIESFQSPLLKEIVSALQHRRGSIEDSLRREGIELADFISEKGPLARKFDFLTQDYKLIRKYFAKI